MRVRKNWRASLKKSIAFPEISGSGQYLNLRCADLFLRVFPLEDLPELVEKYCYRSRMDVQPMIRKVSAKI